MFVHRGAIAIVQCKMFKLRLYVWKRAILGIIGMLMVTPANANMHYKRLHGE